MRHFALLMVGFLLVVLLAACGQPKTEEASGVLKAPQMTGQTSEQQTTAVVDGVAPKLTQALPDGYLLMYEKCPYDSRFWDVRFVKQENKKFDESSYRGLYRVSDGSCVIPVKQEQRIQVAGEDRFVTAVSLQAEGTDRDVCQLIDGAGKVYLETDGIWFDFWQVEKSVANDETYGPIRRGSCGSYLKGGLRGLVDLNGKTQPAVYSRITSDRQLGILVCELPDEKGYAYFDAAGKAVTKAEYDTRWNAAHNKSTEQSDN